MKKMLKNLMKSGLTLIDIYRMKLSDIELLIDISEVEEIEEEPELTTLDKTFPFLF